MNYILRDYQRTGMLRHARQNTGKYDDVTGVDFQTAMDTVVTAQNMFDDLPSNIRKRFANSPVAFLDFVSDPQNMEEARKLGMLQGIDGLDKDGKKIVTKSADKAKTDGDKTSSKVKTDGDKTSSDDKS